MINSSWPASGHDRCAWPVPYCLAWCFSTVPGRRKRGSLASGNCAMDPGTRRSWSGSARCPHWPPPLEYTVIPIYTTSYLMSGSEHPHIARTASGTRPLPAAAGKPGRDRELPLPFYGILIFAGIRVLSLASAAFLLPRGKFRELHYSLLGLIKSWDSGRYLIYRFSWLLLCARRHAPRFHIRLVPRV